MHKLWTEKEKNLVANLWLWGMQSNSLAKFSGRTPSATRGMVRREGLSGCQGSYNHHDKLQPCQWTEAQKDVSAIYPPNAPGSTNERLLAYVVVVSLTSGRNYMKEMYQGQVGKAIDMCLRQLGYVWPKNTPPPAAWFDPKTGNEALRESIALAIMRTPEK